MVVNVVNFSCLSSNKKNQFKFYLFNINIMEISNSCCCCLLRPPDKKLKKPYMRLGKTEIYSNMLKECFEIHLTFLPSDNECGICKVCVGRLQDARDFKLQVQRSQDVLQAQLKGTQVKEEESPKAEKSDDCDPVTEEFMHVAVEVKTEISDPLPMDENEEFKLFMTDLENQSSSVCKQEPLFEVPTKEQKECYFFTPQSVINEVFDNDTNLEPKKQFQERAKNKKPYICDICGRKFTRKVGLNIHKQTHNRGSFSCEICNKQFKWEARLDMHRKIHTGEKQYQCKQCNKLFSNKYYLNKHRRTHSGVKPFTCDICNGHFNQKQSLIIHMRIHTGLGIYQCKSCPVKVSHYSTLKKHIRDNHTSPNYFTCDECNKMFRCKGELIKHMNLHFKWTIYSCELCGLTLSTKTSLQRHRKAHTGEKAFSCQMCNRQFRYKHGLNAHILTHTGEKPHCCEVCGKQFAQKTNLKKHLQIHVEGQIFACELCTKSYSTSEGLRQHRRTHTKNKSQDKSVSKRGKQN